MPDTPADFNSILTSLEPVQCECCGEREISRLGEYPDQGIWCDSCINSGRYKGD